MSTASNGQHAPFSDDQRKHLDFIHNTIARMSAASAAAKGWSLTVATATLGYALTKNAPSIALLGLLSILLFSSVDARYLREERRFRALYDDTRQRGVDVYFMGTGLYVDRKNAKYQRYCTWPQILRSWSVVGFYLPLISVGVAVIVRVSFTSR
jgi:hypothetical protein